MTDKGNIVTIDGPSGSGKSTISQLIAKHFNYQLLDSGALYRLVAWLVINENVSILSVCDQLNINDIEFIPNGHGKSAQLIYKNENITTDIRSSHIAQDASKLASDPLTRQALIGIQRQFSDGSGLVAEGRDMGTTIFPEAKIKFFLTASLEERVKRRYKQLHSLQQPVNIDDLRESIERRDNRDSNRKDSPLVAAENAIIIDTTLLSFEQAVDKITKLINEIN